MVLVEGGRIDAAKGCKISWYVKTGIYQGADTAVVLVCSARMCGAAVYMCVRWRGKLSDDI